LENLGLQLLLNIDSSIAQIFIQVLHFDLALNKEYAALPSINNLPSQPDKVAL
jgi:hypothetical protein